MNRKQMKIVVLSDNRSINPDIGTEHGLSIYVETEKYKCLLDTGASDLLLRNAAKLNVDLSEVDYVFISHGHADHIGGLPAFLQINEKAKIVLSPNIRHQKFYSQRNGLHQISIDIDFEKIKERLIWVGSEIVFENEIQVFSTQKTSFALPKGNRTLLKDAGKGMLPDDFNHELIVTFGTEELFVFTGCGHKGLLNILEKVKARSLGRIRYVMGGFHLLDAKNGAIYETENELEKLGNTLKRNFPMTDFITGHCTGENSYHTLKKQLEFRLIHFFAGYVLEY